MDKKTFLISYDLGFPSRMYKTLDSLIEEKFPENVRILQSTWIVASSLNAPEIFKVLASSLDGDDKMLIIPVSPPWTHWNLDDDRVQKLRDMLPS